MKTGTYAGALAGMLGAFCAIDGARALDVLPDEKAGREACERAFCAMVVKQDAGPPLSCDMVKTWDRDKIKKGSASGKLSWGFGDARCSVKISVPREPLLAALKEAKFTIEVPEQNVTCVIEGSDGKTSGLSARAAPKIEFENGKAKKLWLNIGKIEGDSIFAKFVWASAKLFDGVGIMHSSAIHEINRFMFEQCPKEMAAK